MEAVSESLASLHPEAEDTVLGPTVASQELSDQRSSKFPEEVPGKFGQPYEGRTSQPIYRFEEVPLPFL